MNNIENTLLILAVYPIITIEECDVCNGKGIVFNGVSSEECEDCGGCGEVEIWR